MYHITQSKNVEHKYLPTLVGGGGRT